MEPWQLDAVVASLTQVVTREDVFACVWTGWVGGAIPPSHESSVACYGSRMNPREQCFVVYEGHLGGIASFRTARLPSVWWMKDRSLVALCGFDDPWTWIAGRAEYVAAVRSNDDLEVVR